MSIVFKRDQNGLLRVAAKLVVASEMVIFPLIVMVFTFLEPLDIALQKINLPLSSVPTTHIIESQMSYLIGQGLGTLTALNALRIFNIFIFVSLPIAFLRLISGPLLFDMGDWRVIIKKNNSSIRQFLLGWFFVSTAAVGAFDIRNTAHTIGMTGLLHGWPTFYVAFMTFIFVSGVIFFVEGLLGVVQICFTRQRESKIN